MNANVIKLLCVISVFVMATNAKAQGVFTANDANGNWGTSGTWTLTSGSDGDGIPDSDDDVIIPLFSANRTITVNVTSACKSLSFNAQTTNNRTGIVAVGSQQLTVTNAITFALNGGNGNTNTRLTISTGTVNAGSVSFADIKNQIVFSGAGTLNVTSGNLGSGGTFTASTSIVNFNGSSAQVAGGYTYSTVRSNNTAGVTLAANATITTLVIGNVTSNSIFDDGGFTVSTATTLTVTSGTYRCGATTFPWTNASIGGTVDYDRAGIQTVAAKTYNNLTLSGSNNKTITTTTTVNGTLSMQGTAAAITGTVAFGGSGVLDYQGSGSQTTTSIEFPASSGPSTLKINNASGVTMHATRTITTLTIGDIITSSIFNDGGFQITSTGTLNLTSGTYSLGSAGTATTFPGFTTRTIASGTTVQYGAGVAQTVSTTPSYHHLTFSGAGTKTPASGTLSVAGDWAVGSTTALNTNNPTVNITGNITGSGNITSTSGTLSVAGTWSNNGTFTHNSGTVAFTSGSAQSVPLISYNNLTFSGAGTKTPASGTLSVAGNWAVGSTTALNTNNPTVNVTGNITGSGNITSTSGTLSVAGNWTNNGTFTHNSGTVAYNGGSGQTVASISYNNLTFSGAGTKTPATGTLNVAGDWAAGSTTALNTNNPTVNVTGNISGSGNITSTSGTLTITGNWTNNGTFTHNSGTVTYNKSTGTQTVGGVGYSNLVLSNTSGTNTAGGNVTAVNLTMSNANATLDMATNTLGVTGGTSIGGTIQTQNTSATPFTSGLSWGGTIDYNRGAGGQTVVAGSYTNLKSNNTSGTNTATGTVDVTGVLTMNGGTLDMATNALASTGSTITTSGTGTIQTQNTGTPIPTGRTWSQTIEYNRTGDQTVSSGTYSGLTISGSSGTKTLGGNTSITSALTLTAGTLAVSTRTLTIQTTSVTNAGGGQLSMALSGTLAFDFSGTLTFANAIFSGPLGTLSINSGGRVNLPSTPGVTQSVLNVTLTSGKLGLGASSRLSIGGVVTMTATNCLVSNGTADLQVASGLASVGTIYFDQTTPGTTNTVDNLVFTRGGLTQTVAFGNQIRVKTMLTPTSGTITSNGNVTIGSDATGTARIYPDINSANFAFVGDVKVERYSKAKVLRRFILISSPVDAISVRNAWQDDIFISGTGTGGEICGSGTGNGGTTDKYNSNGFDKTIINTVSIYRYSESGGGWIALPNTSYLLEKGKGYRVLYRGDRGTNDANCNTYLATGSPPAPAASTLNVSGTLIAGQFDVAVDGPTSGNTYGYTLLGNPYPCELDFAKFVATNPTSVSPAYWIYDPNGTNTTTSSTTYLTYTTSGGGELAGFYHSDPGGNPANYANPAFIASGQAFFVQASASGNVTFKETDKGSTTQAGLFKTQAITSKIRIHFRLADDTPIDNIVVRFSDDPSVTPAENSYWDVVSFNGGSYLASVKGTRNYAIQTRPLNFYNDTVQLRMASSATGNFKLLFTSFADFTQAAQIILIDQFTGTQTDVKANPEYAFSITSNSASSGTRFKLVFRSTVSVMPLSYLNIAAAEKAQGVDVTWKVAFEQGVSKYQVERSENGADFTVIGAVNSKGNSNTPVDYSFTDVKPLGGVSYYRIKSIENAGGKYSPIVKLNASKTQPGISIYPNPVKDRLRISLQNNPSFEKATITVRNSQGKTIRQAANVSINGYILDVSDLAAGMYILTITSNNGETTFQKFVKL